MSNGKGMKPGQIANRSGLYQQIGPRGGKGIEVTVVQGEPMPPAQIRGTTYKLVRPTNNKAGQGK